MKSRIILIFFLLMPAIAPNFLFAQALSATDIIRKADEKFNGEKSSYTEMSMTIIRPGWQRIIEFKNWSLGRFYALTLITSPAKEAGQSFLRRGNEMWNWNPAISRLIKLPPSMMSQGWMGSDYTNDDILRESSVVNDYFHEILGEESLNGRLCYKIRMIAKENASIIWGKQFRWIDKKEFLVLRTELFDEDGSLVRTEIGSDIRIMDGRTITSKIEMIPKEEPENKTIVEIRVVKFNVAFDESHFSQQNMKRLR